VGGGGGRRAGGRGGREGGRAAGGEVFGCGVWDGGDWVGIVDGIEGGGAGEVGREGEEGGREGGVDVCVRRRRWRGREGRRERGEGREAG